MKTRTTIDFNGTVGELAHLLADTFPNDNTIIQCVLCTDGSTQPLTDPLFQSLMDFCAEHGLALSTEESKASAHIGLYNAKAMAYKNLIDAIKKIRESTGLGLKESKDFVEKYLRNNPPDGTAHC
jgi:hypothetical protein